MRIAVTRLTSVCLLAALAACSPKSGGSPPGAKTAVQGPAAPAQPHRRAGLWESQMTMSAGTGLTQTTRMCLDATTDAKISVVGRRLTGNRCKETVSQAGGAYVFDSACPMPNGGTMTAHGVAAGDFNTAYTVDVTSTLSPAVEGMPAGSHIKITAKYLGPCLPGQKAGDVMMSNGMTFNINEASAPGSRPGMRPMAGPPARASDEAAD